MEAKLFRRGFREHKKRFDIIQKDISGKTVNDLHEYYYMWKKMKPAEYRGRQRHHSDDDVRKQAWPYSDNTTVAICLCCSPPSLSSLLSSLLPSAELRSLVGV